MDFDNEEFRALAAKWEKRIVDIFSSSTPEQRTEVCASTKTNNYPNTSRSRGSTAIGTNHPSSSNSVSDRTSPRRKQRRICGTGL
jgi:hypothetical protein